MGTGDSRGGIGMTETVASVKKRLAPKKVKLDGETFYVAEGDQLLDEDQLVMYVEQLNLKEQQKKLQADAAALGEQPGVLHGIAHERVERAILRGRDAAVLAREEQQRLDQRLHLRLLVGP